MIRNKTIELLSPAKDADTGIAAVGHGADAVYIGAPKFGARAAAGNSVADIARLVEYAHRYYARVYVTLNTILYDNELEEARRIAQQMYDIGVDALIIQDMGLLSIDLPPIPLHASTQCDNRTVEKVKFLERCGFSQVVLARETPISLMREIAANTTVALEAFVHGALCVSYSGQCYMSAAVTGRSANRGECAHMCRLPYTLTDAEGRVVLRDKHLLSLKDFDASAHLCEMIDAGISSFKIEGRLKDVQYVKNITAYYRQRLDALLGSDVRRPSSSGTTRLFFTPNPQKTFYRGATDYFLAGRHRGMSSPDTPKSLGEPVGTVAGIAANSLTVSTDKAFANGDGLCFLDRDGHFSGFRVNRAEGNRLFPLKMPAVTRGTRLFRNADMAFEHVLSGKTSDRRIAVSVTLSETPEGFRLSVTDEDGISASVCAAEDKAMASNPDRAMSSYREQLSRLGDTPFAAREINISFRTPWFIPISKIGRWRRELADALIAEREARRPRQSAGRAECDMPFPSQSAHLDYRANCANRASEQFYLRHGIESVSPAFEIVPTTDAELMRTKYCLRYELGACLKEGGGTRCKEPLYITSGGVRFRLAFDCTRCEMTVCRAK